MKKKRILRSAAVLAVVLGILGALYLAAHPAEKATGIRPEEYMEYENAVVEQVLSDSTEADPVAENHERGSQLLIVTVKTGQYAGKQMKADNTVGPMYGQSFRAGDSVTVGISTYADGTLRCYIYEYNRTTGLLIILAAFLAVTVLVGGKVGVKINRMVKEFGGPDAKIKTFSGYIDECWRDAMEHSDTQLKTAARPAKSSK